jgi:hypothetical protein
MSPRDQLKRLLPTRSIEVAAVPDGSPSKPKVEVRVFSTAHNLRGVISSVFRLAIVTLRAETDPTAALRGALLPAKRQGRTAIIDQRNLARSSAQSTPTPVGRP